MVTSGYAVVFGRLRHLLKTYIIRRHLLVVGAGFICVISDDSLHLVFICKALTEMIYCVVYCIVNGGEYSGVCVHICLVAQLTWSRHDASVCLTEIVWVLDIRWQLLAEWRTFVRSQRVSQPCWTLALSILVLLSHLPHKAVHLLKLRILGHDPIRAWLALIDIVCQILI